MKGNAKIDPRRIIAAHRRTYVSARTGKRRWSDHLVIEGLPVIVLGVSLWQGVRLDDSALMALLTVSGLLAALLFGVMLQLSERAMQWAESEPEPGKDTSQHASYLEELAANAGYASLVCITSAVIYTVALIVAKDGSSGHILSAIGLGLGVHLVLVLLMVMKRVFALTQERLIRARTGATMTRGNGERRAP